jgi:LPS export ABC transporter permease LptF
MGILNRYVLVQIAVPSLLAVALIAVVAVATEVQEQVKDLPMALVSLTDIGRLMGYFLPALVSHVIPITYMMGILLAFGRLSQHGEIVAMKAAGIPLKRLIVPVILVGGLLSVACFWVQDRVRPWAIGRAFDFVVNEVERRITLDMLHPGVMHEFRGWRVYIGEKDAGTNTLRDIVILKPEKGSLGAVVYHADSARLVQDGDQSRLEMLRGYYVPPSEGDNVTCATFEKLSILLPQFKAREMPRTWQAMTVGELCGRQQELEAEYQASQSELKKADLKNERQEIAERVSLPFACLAVSFVAAPLGARAKRSGRSYTFAAGFIIILSYYTINLMMKSDSLFTLPTFLLRAWTPNIALCLAGLFFVWRVDRV